MAKHIWGPTRQWPVWGICDNPYRVCAGCGLSDTYVRHFYHGVGCDQREMPEAPGDDLGFSTAKWQSIISVLKANGWQEPSDDDEIAGHFPNMDSAIAALSADDAPAEGCCLVCAEAVTANREHVCEPCAKAVAFPRTPDGPCPECTEREPLEEVLAEIEAIKIKLQEDPPKPDGYLSRQDTKRMRYLRGPKGLDSIHNVSVYSTRQKRGSPIWLTTSPPWEEVREKAVQLQGENTEDYLRRLEVQTAERDESTAHINHQIAEATLLAIVPPTEPSEEPEQMLIQFRGGRAVLYKKAGGYERPTAEDLDRLLAPVEAV